MCPMPDIPPSRLKLVPPWPDDPVLARAFREIRSRGAEPLHMHRVLGHSALVFQAYLHLAYALREHAKVARRYRELIILRTVQRAGGDYEFVQHTPMALSCGITAAQIEAVADWRRSGLFDQRERAILGYADEMADGAGVSDDTFAGLAAEFDPQEIVELTVTAGFYRAAAAVTQALEIQPEDNAGQTSYGKTD
jgi:alkylhydroperoxidase family enzyme